MKGVIITMYTDEMLNLYIKIRNNTATTEEQDNFKILVMMSCVDEKVLMHCLEEAYTTKKRNNTPCKDRVLTRTLSLCF